MYPARQQKNDERRPGDLEAENEKLKAELEELKEIHAEKTLMFAELREINIRLEGKLEGGGGHPFAHELAMLPLFFEGEINKELVFRNSVLEVENRKLKGVKRKSDNNLEVKINRELNTKYKILQVENRNLRSVIGALEEKFKGEINRELNATNFTLDVKNEKLESEIEKLEDILESEIERFEDTLRRNKFLEVENRRLKAELEKPEAEKVGATGEWLMKAIAVVLALWLTYGFLVLLWTRLVE